MDENATVYDIRLFICSLLRKLKLILLAALIGALLLGGFQAVKAWFADRASQESLTVNRKKIKELQDTQAFNERLLADYQTYVDASLYQNLNPLAITRTSLYNHVRYVPDSGAAPELQDPETIARNENVILNAYRLVGLTEPVVAALDALLGESHATKYYDEIITVDILADASLVRISALYDDPDLSRQLADTVQSALYADLSERVRPHTLSLIRVADSTAADPDMRTAQSDMLTKIDKLTIEQKAIDRQIEALKNPAAESQLTWQTIVQFAVFGALIGLALSLLLLFFVDAVSLKLDQEKTLTTRYQLPVLGRLPAAAASSGKARHKRAKSTQKGQNP